MKIKLDDKMNDVFKLREAGFRNKAICYKLDIEPKALKTALQTMARNGAKFPSYREAIAKRNQAVLERYNAGESCEVISQDIMIQDTAVYAIIRKFRNNGVFVRPNRLESGDKNER